VPQKKKPVILSEDARSLRVAVEGPAVAFVVTLALAFLVIIPARDLLLPLLVLR
jgi:hypothetical protein